MGLVKTIVRRRQCLRMRTLNLEPGLRPASAVTVLLPALGPQTHAVSYMAFNVGDGI